MQKRLYRSRTDTVLAGVCSGLGKYIGIEPNLMRLITVALFLFGSVGFWMYIVMAIIVPKEPEPGFMENCGLYYTGKTSYNVNNRNMNGYNGNGMYQNNVNRNMNGFNNGYPNGFNNGNPNGNFGGMPYGAPGGYPNGNGFQNGYGNNGFQNGYGNNGFQNNYGNNGFQNNGFGNNGFRNGYGNNGFPNANNGFAGNVYPDPNMNQGFPNDNFGQYRNFGNGYPNDIYGGASFAGYQPDPGFPAMPCPIVNTDETADAASGFAVDAAGGGGKGGGIA